MCYIHRGGFLHIEISTEGLNAVNYFKDALTWSPCCQHFGHYMCLNIVHVHQLLSLCWNCTPPWQELLSGLSLVGDRISLSPVWSSSRNVNNLGKKREFVYTTVTPKDANVFKTVISVPTTSIKTVRLEVNSPVVGLQWKQNRFIHWMSPKHLIVIYDTLSLFFAVRVFLSSSVYCVGLFLCFSEACLNALSFYGAPKTPIRLGTRVTHMSQTFVSWISPTHSFTI